MRPALLASGLVGLAIDGMLTSIGLGVRLGGLLPAFLAGWVAWAAVLVLLGISAIDFPVMLFALRKIAADPKRASDWPLSIANAIFVLFAAVYGLVGLLLTGLVVRLPDSERPGFRPVRLGARCGASGLLHTQSILEFHIRGDLMQELSDIRNWLVDMDGVLYHGNRRMPGAAEFIAALQADDTPFLLVTNNSTLTPEQYVAKVGAMGIPVQPENVLTSSIATAEYLTKLSPGAAVQMIGEGGLRTALTSAASSWSTAVAITWSWA